jgi:uncharacterized protein YhfF
MTPFEFWNEYLNKTGQKADEAVYSGELCFEDSSWAGMSQLELVLDGRKTAVFTALPSFEINRELVPAGGEVYIVEDTGDEPRAIIKVKEVKILPFKDISWELARLDGENENLEDWRSKEREFFEDEADLCGFDFEDDTEIVCEIFEIIYKKSGQ